MTNLYLIGGSPRCGKTIIFKEVIEKKPMVAISTDALREMARYTLFEESYVSVQSLSFQGDVTFHRAGEEKDISHKKHFSYEIDEEELTWKAVVGLIQCYDRNPGRSLIIEGVAITPERVKSLSLKNFKLKAVFLGFNNESYLKNILDYSHEHKDWLYKKVMIESGGDYSVAETWFKEELIRSKEVAMLAEKYGYKFFSPQEKNFQKYRDEVVEYLLA